MKSELKRQCAQDPVAMAYEIERLNTQIAMQEEALIILAKLGNGNQFGNSDGNMIATDALCKTSSDWLRQHDAKIRDSIINECITEISDGICLCCHPDESVETAQYCCEILKDLLPMAEQMKGTK